MFPWFFSSTANFTKALYFCVFSTRDIIWDAQTCIGGSPAAFTLYGGSKPSSNAISIYNHVYYRSFHTFGIENILLSHLYASIEKDYSESSGSFAIYLPGQSYLMQILQIRSLSVKQMVTVEILEKWYSSALGNWLTFLFW